MPEIADVYAGLLRTKLDARARSPEQPNSKFDRGNRKAVPAEEAAAQSQVIDFAGYTGGYLVQVPWDQIGADKQKVIAMATEISSQVQMYQVKLALHTQGESKGTADGGC